MQFETVTPFTGPISPHDAPGAQRMPARRVFSNVQSAIVTGLSVWRRNPRALVTPTFVPVISTSGSHDSFAT